MALLPGLSLDEADHSHRSKCPCTTYTEDKGQLIRKTLARQNLVIGSWFFNVAVAVSSICK